MAARRSSSSASTRPRTRSTRRAITKAQYDLIDPGTPESVVRARLGEPLSEESFRRRRLDCVYYAQKDEGLFGIDDFEFCFRDGVLVSKSFDVELLSIRAR